MRLHHPIPILLSAHFTIGMLAAIASADQPAVSSAIFIAIVFCQATLIGMWGGLGRETWMLRLPCVAAGTTYLAVQLGLGLDELESEIFLLVVLPTLLVTAVTWLVRFFKGNLQRVTPGQPELAEGLQFSIRHLMLLTFVVACITALGKALAPTMRGLEVMAIISVLGLCYTAVALASMWAVLGQGHPSVRTIFVGLIALMAGIVGSYAAESDDNFFWAWTTVLQAVFLVSSLWVMRMAGYRFAAKSTLGGQSEVNSTHKSRVAH